MSNTNVAIWSRANGRFAMMAFWALMAAYTKFTYFT